MNRKSLLLTAVITIIISACSGENGDRDIRPTYDTSISHSALRPVTFAVFGNTGCTVDGVKTYESLIRAVNEYGVDFSVNLGNNLSDGIPPAGVKPVWDAVEKNVEQFGAPVYPVVGKNDVFDFESDVEYSNRYGPMWYSFMREGKLFIVLNTEDDAYREGFGTKPRIGEEQLEWLVNSLKDSKNVKSTVLFMNNPLWLESPALWTDRILPVLKTGDVNLIVTCFENGLYDWGIIDGIRTVSTGCTGSMKSKNPGLFPHFLIITVNGDKSLFRVLLPDGTNREGIPVNRDRFDAVMEVSAPLTLPVLKTDPSWNINETLNLSFENSFESPLSIKLDFSVYTKTSWEISPSAMDFSILPGVTKTVNLGIKGLNPELGPVPKYSSELKLGETIAFGYDGLIEMEIPLPRTGEVVPISAQIRRTVPYDFDGKSLKIPVEIKTIDTCGRLVIYNESETEIPVCLHVAPLRDFKAGINEFIWDGLDLRGNPAARGTLSYKIFIYNKKAPATWVAVGPPNKFGNFSVERTFSGLTGKTHTGDTLISYRIGSSTGNPKSEEIQSFTDILEGLSLNGMSRGEGDIVYLSTDAGIACVYVKMKRVIENVSFGENGFVRLTDYRSRLIGSPSYHNGLVYVGIGGEEGSPPGILVLDCESGEEVSFIRLGEFFGEYAEPPSICIDDRGIYCAHPDDGPVIMMSHSGDVLWVNEAGGSAGDMDSDGRSHNYGISVDRYGFSYVNTPGYSARCGVIGPDGKGLFRVILVQLPGLRVSSVFPMIEGKPTDGLYFVTRGGDVPYVFHVPFTILAGEIVDRANLQSKE